MEKLNSTVKLINLLKSIVENDAELKKDGELSELFKNLDMTIGAYVESKVDIDNDTIHSVAELVQVFLLNSPLSNHNKAVYIVKKIYDEFHDDKNIMEILNKIVDNYNSNIDNKEKINIEEIVKGEKQEKQEKQEGVEEKVVVENKRPRGRPVGSIKREKIAETIKERRPVGRPRVNDNKAIDVKEKIKELQTNKYLKIHNIQIDYDKYLDKFVFSLLDNNSKTDQAIKNEITNIFKKQMSDIAYFAFASDEAEGIRHRLNTLLYAMIKQNIFVINLIAQASKVMKESNKGIIKIELNTNKYVISKMYKKVLDEMLQELINKYSGGKKNKKEKENE